MLYTAIEKPKSDWAIIPNLHDYEKTCAGFSWDAARRELDGLPGGRGLNIAHEAVDRHANGALRDHLALRWISKGGESRDISYAELRSLTNRFANVLKGLGLAKSERVFMLAGRIPELYISALATLKNGNVFCPLFSAFGPEPIHQRISIGDGRVLVTTPMLYKRKVAELRASLPGLKHVLLVGTTEEVRAIPNTLDFHQLMNEASDDFEIAQTSPDDLALLHFTSGTTGKPKGAMHVHQAVVAHHKTGQFALDFHPDDIFWCTADPGWITGTSYGIIAPLTNGITSIIDEAEFDAERWYSLIQKQKVTIWYTAPTAVRMMMKIGTEVVRKYDFRHLRLIASVGEPLNPEAVVWGREAFGLPIHDNWWQTETGGIMISPVPGAIATKPGSATRALPGIAADVVTREGKPVAANQGGFLVVKRPWPGMLRTIFRDPERYKSAYFSQIDGMYFTGDGARRDEDGYFWIMGRVDDVINVSGHRLSTMEVESALVSHETVAEAACVGKPDALKGQGIMAFVTLEGGRKGDDKLREELKRHVVKEIGALARPDEIRFTDSLPKTRSGKIMRRLLRQIASGDETLGDVTTLEDLSVMARLREDEE